MSIGLKPDQILAVFESGNFPNYQRIESDKKVNKPLVCIMLDWLSVIFYAFTTNLSLEFTRNKFM